MLPSLPWKIYLMSIVLTNVSASSLILLSGFEKTNLVLGERLQISVRLKWVVIAFIHSEISKSGLCWTNCLFQWQPDRSRFSQTKLWMEIAFVALSTLWAPTFAVDHTFRLVWMDVWASGCDDNLFHRPADVRQLDSWECQFGWPPGGQQGNFCSAANRSFDFSSHAQVRIERTSILIIWNKEYLNMQSPSCVCVEHKLDFWLDLFRFVELCHLSSNHSKLLS